MSKIAYHTPQAALADHYTPVAHNTAAAAAAHTPHHTHHQHTHLLHPHQYYTPQHPPQAKKAS